MLFLGNNLLWLWYLTKHIDTFCGEKKAELLNVLKSSRNISVSVVRWKTDISWFDSWRVRKIFILWSVQDCCEAQIKPPGCGPHHSPPFASGGYKWANSYQVSLLSSWREQLQFYLSRTTQPSKSVQIRIFRTVILPVVLYGYETWSLTPREKCRMRVFENRVLRRIFGPKRDEVRGEWRKALCSVLLIKYHSSNQ